MSEAVLSNTQFAYSVAIRYSNGVGVPQDYVRASHFFRQAAELGLAEASFALGFLYESGCGDMPVNYDLARQHYEIAAEQGNVDALFNLGVFYERARGVEQDIEAAMRYYELAAGQDHADAIFNLGLLFQENEDYAKARQYFERAAAKGHAYAHFELGLIYENGHGVPQDYQQAHYHYDIAAQNGLVDALFHLGILHANGQGVPQDEEQARQYYERAAQQGHAEAEIRLRKFADRNQDALFPLELSDLFLYSLRVPPFPDSLPSEDELIYINKEELDNRDVICGRGFTASTHPGNVEYLRTINFFRVPYEDFGSQHGEETKLHSAHLETGSLKWCVKKHGSALFCLLSKKTQDTRWNTLFKRSVRRVL